MPASSGLLSRQGCDISLACWVPGIGRPHAGPASATRRHLALLVVFALGLLTLGVGPALAQPLACGAVVTQDTTLANDLLDGPGNGLVMGADGITVDLNGHTISGQIIPGSPGQVGIDNRGHDDVTIRNGHGQVLRPGRGPSRPDRPEPGREPDHGPLPRVRAILLESGGSANRFTGNRVDRAGTVGIGIQGATAASRDNVVSGNVSNAANVAGIALRSGAITGTLIEGNTATGAQDQEQWGAGIVVSDDGAANILRTVVRSNRKNGSTASSVATHLHVLTGRSDSQCCCVGAVSSRSVPPSPVVRLLASTQCGTRGERVWLADRGCVAKMAGRPETSSAQPARLRSPPNELRNVLSFV